VPPCNVIIELEVPLFDNEKADDDLIVPLIVITVPAEALLMADDKALAVVTVVPPLTLLAAEELDLLDDELEDEELDLLDDELEATELETELEDELTLPVTSILSKFTPSEVEAVAVNLILLVPETKVKVLEAELHVVHESDPKLFVPPPSPPLTVTL
jgi:hypothetical protein